MIRSYRDQAVVIRTQKLGEADRIVTLLTAEHGLVRAVAKGVRRPTSKFGARLEPFGLIDVQLHMGRSLDIVTQVEAKTLLGAIIAQNVKTYACASAMGETAERLTQDGAESSHTHFQLLYGGLWALAYRRHDPDLVMNSYLLRALALSGWAPTFDQCAMCDVPGPHRSFSIADGGALCEGCRKPGTAVVSTSSMTLMGALLAGDWEHAQDADDVARHQASGLVVAYSQWHLERRLRSLGVLECVG